MAGTEGRLAGRCAIVTGGGHGLGRAYARRLGAEGAQVVVAELDGEAGDQVARELADAGVEATAVRTDVADEAQVRAMVAAAVDAFGKVDVLVNNAAMFTRVPVTEGGLDDLTVDHFEQVLRVNVIGTWLSCRAAVADMRRRGYGKIVNVSSGTVFKGSAGTVLQYVTSKSAILGFTRSLARLLGPEGIRVNCVAPGFTLTDDEPTEEQLEAALRRAQAERRSLARVARPEDIVGTVAFLASPDSDFLTGQTIVVDGGAYMH